MSEVPLAVVVLKLAKQQGVGNTLSFDRCSSGTLLISTETQRLFLLCSLLVQVTISQLAEKEIVMFCLFFWPSQIFWLNKCFDLQVARLMFICGACKI